MNFLQKLQYANHRRRMVFVCSRMGGGDHDHAKTMPRVFLRRIEAAVASVAQPYKQKPIRRS